MTEKDNPLKKELREEIEFYNSIKSELLGKAKNEYALIKGNELVGTYRSKEDAIRQGYKLFGNTPFLVKHVVEVELPEYFTSNLIALT